MLKLAYEYGVLAALKAAAAEKYAGIAIPPSLKRLAAGAALGGATGAAASQLSGDGHMGRDIGVGASLGGGGALALQAIHKRLAVPTAKGAIRDAVRAAEKQHGPLNDASRRVVEMNAQNQFNLDGLTATARLFPNVPQAPAGAV
jgi:hypothetical protein